MEDSSGKITNLNPRQDIDFNPHGTLSQAVEIIFGKGSTWEKDPYDPMKIIVKVVRPIEFIDVTIQIDGGCNGESSGSESKR